MSEEWIRVNAKLLDHPKLFRMTKFINEKHPGSSATNERTFCALVRTWCAINAHARTENDDAIVHYCDTDAIDVMSQLRGLGDAMVSVGWAIEEPGSIVRFPRFLTYNITPEERKKMKDRERLARKRGATKVRQTGDKNATKTRQTGDSCSVMYCSVSKPKRESDWDVFSLLLPEAMRTERMKTAWGLWVEYRGQKLKPTTLRLQAKKLTEFGLEGAIGSIEQSIGQAWTGLFPVRVDPRNPLPKPMAKPRRNEGIANEAEDYVYIAAMKRWREENGQ